MSYGRAILVEPVREVAAASITASYVALGAATTHYGRVFGMYNSCNVDIYVSLDGVNNHFRIAASSFQLFDVTANEVSPEQGYFLSKGTQFYIKETEQGAPGSGRFCIEVIAA